MGKVRVVAVSDGHINYDTGNEQEHRDAADAINNWNNDEPIDLLVHNGDLHQSDEDLATVRSEFFDRLNDSNYEWYVTYGNHEYINVDDWEDEFGHTPWEAFKVPYRGRYTDKNLGVLIVQSATDYDDGAGHDFSSEDACPDNINPGWIEERLDEFENDETVQGVIVFCHVPPRDEWGSDGNCFDTETQFQRDIVDAVFVGHRHTENDVEDFNGVEYHFTNHLGDRGDGVEGIRLFELEEVYD